MSDVGQEPPADDPADDYEVLGTEVVRTDLAWSRSGLALAVSAAAILKVIVDIGDYRAPIVILIVLVAGAIVWALAIADARLVWSRRSRAVCSPTSAGSASSRGSRAPSRSARWSSPAFRTFECSGNHARTAFVGPDMQRIKTFAALAAVAVLFAGCSRDNTPSGSPAPTATDRPELASQPPSLRLVRRAPAWAATEELAPRVGAYGFSGGSYRGSRAGHGRRRPRTSRAASGADASGGSSGADPTGAGGYAEPGGILGTNVQVEGVDEPDIVKTDGKRIVSIVDGELAAGVGRDLGGPRHAHLARRHVDAQLSSRATTSSSSPPRDHGESGGKTSPAMRPPPRPRTCPARRAGRHRG